MFQHPVYKTGGHARKGTRQERREGLSEVGSRHHLLQMFAAINHPCSGCSMFAATKTDEAEVKEAKQLSFFMESFCV